MQLRKGQNRALAASSATVTCRWRPIPDADADLSALLLTAGKLRSDADFVFYNQPHSRDGAIRPEGKRETGGLIEDRTSCSPWRQHRAPYFTSDVLGPLADTPLVGGHDSALRLSVFAVATRGGNPERRHRHDSAEYGHHHDGATEETEQ
ncbi:hypothetical protein CJ179_34445 [Rhodococcus sp. ACS1]|uniref:TerD domain-containing protein n=1 Tax=Rhodococcus jostii TaxID=132919 RepID=A0A1H5LW24_RHOJO|nr:hypothetical protein CJ179_34445 [Rhodococcus sp. ACS1]SEE80458.1 TerD domain-containing protein [Rhodococcus jostii]